MQLATIIHLSDLHFGSTFRATRLRQRLIDKLPARHPHSPAVVKDLTVAVRDLLDHAFEHSIPAAVVHTGDLTQSGRERQFAMCFRYLRHQVEDHAGNPVGLGVKCHSEPLASTEPSWTPRLLDIPGNHDYWKHKNKWFRKAFRSSFPADFPSEHVLTHGGIPVAIVYGLDSNLAPNRKSWLAKGFVEPAKLGHLAARLKRPNPHKAAQIVCVHHPLESNGNPSDERIRLENRELVSATLFGAGADLVLGGHIHEYRRFGGRAGIPLNVIAGSAAQQHAAHNFLVFDIFNDRIEWAMYAYDPEGKLAGFVRQAEYRQAR